MKLKLDRILSCHLSRWILHHSTAESWEQCTEYNQNSNPLLECFVFAHQGSHRCTTWSSSWYQMSLPALHYACPRLVAWAVRAIDQFGNLGRALSIIYYLRSQCCNCVATPFTCWYSLAHCETNFTGEGSLLHGNDWECHLGGHGESGDCTSRCFGRHSNTACGEDFRTRERCHLCACLG